VTAPITANTITVTQQAQQVFEQNTTDLSQLQDTVTSALSDLTNSGMDPVSLGQLTGALEQWDAALQDMISLSEWMAETLETTWQLIQKNEQDNTDLASGLTVQAEPLEPVLPPLSMADNTTVAPGQIVQTGRVTEGTLLT
jgi:hypothetical protein